MQRASALGQLLISEPTVLTIGKFDGIHIGHQALLRQSVARAHQRGLPCAVLTFDPHPATVINPGRVVRMLTTLEDRLALIEALGPDLTIVVPFTRETMETPARAYMQRICETVRLSELWVGDNFALGRKREGTVDYLGQLGRSLGYSVTALPRTLYAGQPVSASRVRELLVAGDVSGVAALLGRPYSASASLQPSAHGAPLRLVVAPPYDLPAPGIYSVQISHGSKSYRTLARNSWEDQGCFELAALPDLAREGHLRITFVEQAGVIEDPRLVRAAQGAAPQHPHISTV